MMLKQVFLAHFEPVATGFGSWKIQKCLENGPFWDQKWVKNGLKTGFSKSDPRPFGMLKQVFLARFEPVLTNFSPFHHMYAPLCALRTYLRVHVFRVPFDSCIPVKWSRLMKKLQRNVNSVLPGVRMFCSFKSQANFRRVFHRKLMQTLSKIESPELQNLKQNLSQDADDFLSALNFE